MSVVNGFVLHPTTLTRIPPTCNTRHTNATAPSLHHPRPFPALDSLPPHPTPRLCIPCSHGRRLPLLPARRAGPAVVAGPASRSGAGLGSATASAFVAAGSGAGMGAFGAGGSCSGSGGAGARDFTQWASSVKSRIFPAAVRLAIPMTAACMAAAAGTHGWVGSGWVGGLGCCWRWALRCHGCAYTPRALRQGAIRINEMTRHGEWHEHGKRHKHHK